jgi:transposase
MKRYIGIDVHSESCTCVVMSAAGKKLREARIDTNGQALTDFVRGLSGEKHVCVEEGTHAEWLYELLEPLVTELVVVLPEKSTGNKSDSADAWQRADELRRGDIKRPVFKAPNRFSRLRAAAKTYLVTQRDMVRVKARLNALYRSRGFARLKSDIYDLGKRESWLARLPSAQRDQAELFSTQLDALLEAHELAQNWLLDESKKVPITRRFLTVPGIGEIRAPLIVAYVISPYRFRTRRQFWSYCGLGVVTRSTSDWTRARNGSWERRTVPQTRGLNRNRQPVLKSVFVGAAETVIRQMPKHPLTCAYQKQLEAGTKPNLARLTVARRIAGATLAMWKNKENYDPSKQQRED